MSKSTKTAAKKPVTRYGAKTAPGKGHSFKWEEAPGVGVGVCSHCTAKLKFVESGPRGGKHRMYWHAGVDGAKGKWLPEEPKCKREPATKAA